VRLTQLIDSLKKPAATDDAAESGSPMESTTDHDHIIDEG
jgi:hypothetical protein